MQEARSEVFPKDKETKNKDRFYLQKDGAQFSGTIYVDKGVITEGKNLEVTIREV